MFDSILVVCIGNICRSPTGERLLKKYAPGKQISSAGLKALFNQPANISAIEIANQNGLSLEGHQSRQLTPEMCREHDLILVMEKKHIEAVCHMDPVVRGKTMLFGHWLERSEISDPFSQSHDAFEFSFRLLNQSAQKWADVLTR